MMGRFGIALRRCCIDRLRIAGAFAGCLDL